MRMLSIIWLVFLLSFTAGLVVMDQKVWPYSVVQELKKFVRGGAGEQTDLVGRIKNDLNLGTGRHSNRLNAYEYSNPEKFVEVGGLGLNPRRENPRLYLSPQAPKGYRLLQGPFDFADARHGAVLLGPGGDVVNTWRVSENDVTWKHQEDTNTFPHGIEVGHDGSYVTTFGSKGSSLAKYDWCNALLWRTQGNFHHSISFTDGQESLWTWKKELLVEVDYASGEVLRQISLKRIMEVNPDIDLDQGPLAPQ